MSQRLLAQASGTSRQAVTAIEAGRVSPTLRTLDRLLAACGMQMRIALEPLMADLAARVDALAGPLPELDQETWRHWVLSLEDDPALGDDRIARMSPRSGPVTWAVDGAAALVLQQLAVPQEDVDVPQVVVVLDDAARAWMAAIWLKGYDERERTVQDWWDSDLERIASALGEPRPCAYGLVSVRVVAELPPTVCLAVPWADQPIRVATVDEVERSHPAHAEVLQRWRARRAS